MASNSAIVNPNEHLKIPDWINAAYFAPILAKDEPDHVKVTKFTPTAAIPPGENFTSVMIRIHMELKMKNGSVKAKSYVLKTALDDNKGGAAVRDFGLFPKEMAMYKTYIPAFEALYREAGKKLQLAPKCLFTEASDGCINFVFEDLKQKRFRNANRLDGFDMDHMRRSLRILAEFHAASAVYAEQNGPFPKIFDTGFINPNTRNFLQNGYSCRAELYKKAMATWGMKDAEKYIEKFPTFEQYWKCGLRTTQADPTAFNVLIHGDYWSSNIMMNYLDDGAVDEMLMVDYQICKWGSPAEDLLFFLTISPAKELRIKEFDNFIQIYHEHLIDCLKLLKYKQRLPKLREIHMKIFDEDTSFYAFLAVFNHLVGILLPTDKDSNIDMLNRTDEEGRAFCLRALTNPLFAAAMKDLFPFFHRRGIFNFEDYD